MNRFYIRNDFIAEPPKDYAVEEKAPSWVPTLFVIAASGVVSFCALTGAVWWINKFYQWVA